MSDLGHFSLPFISTRMQLTESIKYKPFCTNVGHILSRNTFGIHVMTVTSQLQPIFHRKVCVICVFVFICDCPGVFTFITKVKFGQVASLVRLFIHGAVLPLLVCAQIHGFVLHLDLSEKGKRCMLNQASSSSHTFAYKHLPGRYKSKIRK